MIDFKDTFEEILTELFLRNYAFNSCEEIILKTGTTYRWKSLKSTNTLFEDDFTIYENLIKAEFVKQVIIWIGLIYLAGIPQWYYHLKYSITLIKTWKDQAFWFTDLTNIYILWCKTLLKILSSLEKVNLTWKNLKY